MSSWNGGMPTTPISDIGKSNKEEKQRTNENDGAGEKEGETDERDNSVSAIVLKSSCVRSIG